MEEITGETLIADIIAINPDAQRILLGAGMHCIGCMMAHGETLEEACAVHGIEDMDALLSELNDHE